jgi:hypothetical protein
MRSVKASTAKMKSFINAVARSSIQCGDALINKDQPPAILLMMAGGW